MTSGLRHTTHPFQFCAIEVVCSRDFSTLIINTFLTLFQIVTVVAAIGVDGMVVELHNHRAHAIQEETIVGNHQQGLIASVQETLQPFYHFKIKMVCRLVEYQQVRIGNQNIGQGHAFLLTTAQFSHGLLEIAYLQLRQNLLSLQYLLFFALMIKTGIEHTFVRVELWGLFQHAHLDITTKNNLARIVAFLAREHGKQRRFSCTVLGYQSHLLTLSYRKANVFEKHQRAKRFRKALNIEIWILLSHSLIPY